MTASLGQLAEPDLGLPGRARGVQLRHNRPVDRERFRSVTRRDPGSPRVGEKLRPEERIQGRGGGGLVSCRGVLGPERVLERPTKQPIRLGSEVLVGLGSRALEYVDRLLRLALREPGLGEQDRKSTRLNSSHQIISYAVFCLKKKKVTAK